MPLVLPRDQGPSTAVGGSRVLGVLAQEVCSSFSEVQGRDVLKVVVVQAWIWTSLVQR